MKKSILSFVIAGLVYFTYACGGNQKENSQDHVPGDTLDNNSTDPYEGNPAVDSLRADTTDTIGQPVPTPPAQ